MESMRGTLHTEATHLNMGVMSEDSDHENEVMSARIKKRDADKAAYKAEVKQAKQDFEQSLVARAIRLVHNHPCATFALGMGVAITAGGAVLMHNAFTPNRAEPAVLNPEQPKTTTANPHTTSASTIRNAYTTGGAGNNTTTGSGVSTANYGNGNLTTTAGNGTTSAMPTNGTILTTPLPTFGTNGTTADLSANATLTPTQHFTGLSNHTTPMQNATTPLSGFTTPSFNATTAMQNATTGMFNVTDAGNGTNTTAGGTTTPMQVSLDGKPATTPDFGCFPSEQAELDASKNHNRHRRSAPNKEKWHYGLPRYVVTGKNAGIKASGTCNNNGGRLEGNTCAKTNDLNVVKISDRGDKCVIEKVGGCSTEVSLSGRESVFITESPNLRNIKNKCGVAFVHADKETPTATFASCVPLNTKTETKFANILAEKMEKAIRDTKNENDGWSLFNKFKTMANEYERLGFKQIALKVRQTTERVLDIQDPNGLPNYVLSSNKVGISMPYGSSGSGGDRCMIDRTDRQQQNNTFFIHGSNPFNVVHPKKDSHSMVSERYNGDLFVTGQAGSHTHEILAQRVYNGKNCQPDAFYSLAKNDRNYDRDLIKKSQDGFTQEPLGNCVITDIPHVRVNTQTTEAICIKTTDHNMSDLIKSSVAAHIEGLGSHPNDPTVRGTIIELTKMADAFDASVKGNELKIGDYIREGITEGVCTFSDQYVKCPDPEQVPTQAPKIPTQPATMPKIPTFGTTTSATMATVTNGTMTTGVNNGTTTVEGITGINATNATTPIADNANGTVSHTTGFTVPTQNATQAVSGTTTVINGTTTVINGTTTDINETSTTLNVTDGLENLWTTTKTPTTGLPDSANKVPQSKWKFNKEDQGTLGTAMAITGGAMTLAALGAILWGNKKNERSYDLDNARKNSMRKAYQAARQEDNGYEGGDEEQALAHA